MSSPSKMRPIAVEYFSPCFDRFDSSDNKPLAVKAVYNSWITRMIHHASRRIDGGSDAILAIVDHRTVCIV